MTNRVDIVGGGLAGLSAAVGAVGGEFETHVWEKKNVIGGLYKSTGGIARYWLEQLPFHVDCRRSIVDEIREVVIYPPLHSEKYPEVKMSSSEAVGYVLDQPKLEKILEEKALDGGVMIHRNVRVTGINALPDSYIIGADGAFSVIARETVGLPDQWHIHKCLEYWIPREDSNHRLEIYFREYCPKGYVWVFPAGEYSKIGAGVPIAEKTDLRKVISRFLDESGYGRIGKDTPVYGGVVPTAKPLKPESITPRENVALVGDAGRLVNSATGGGIHLALLSGYNAARVLTRTGSYELYRDWYRVVAYPQLSRWYKIRSILVSSTPRELSEFISIAREFVGEVFTGRLTTLNPILLLSQMMARVATHPKTSIKIFTHLFWESDD